MYLSLPKTGGACAHFQLPMETIVSCKTFSLIFVFYHTQGISNVYIDTAELINCNETVTSKVFRRSAYITETAIYALNMRPVERKLTLVEKTVCS